MNQVAEVLRRAVRVLDERGWTQSVMYDEDRRCCARGALLVAGNELSYSNFLPISADAEDELSNQLGGTSVVAWNDEPGRTVDEVKAALLAAAERAESTA